MARPIRSLFCIGSLAATALLVTACGGTIHRTAAPMTVHLDGKVTGDYVRETSATGFGFLVPTSVLSGQGGTTFQTAAPPARDPGMFQQGPKVSSSQWSRQRWWIGPNVEGNTPQGARVELLVTGDPGRSLYLGFEETCGMVDGGRAAIGASNGATGQRLMRSPAVMLVPALRASPHTSCLVSGVVTTRGRNQMHVSLIDY